MSIDASLLEDFVPEAGEHLEALEGCLLRLPQNPEDRDILDEAFRAIHTIKGAAQFIGLERVATLSHRLEDLLDLLRTGEKPWQPDMLDVLMMAQDRLSRLIAELAESTSEQSPVDDLVELLGIWLENDETTEEMPPEEMPAELQAALAAEEALPEEMPAELQAALAAEEALPEEMPAELQAALAAEEALPEEMPAELQAALAAEEDLSPAAAVAIDLELLQDFLAEGGEHLEALEATLLRLSQENQENQDRSLLDDAFRPIHTIKGAAQFIGLERIATLSHRLEDLLDLLREGERTWQPAMEGPLMQAHDRLAQLMQELASSQTEQSPVDDLVATIGALITGTEIPDSSDQPGFSDTEIRDETYEEDYDQELFEIFTHQLQDTYHYLATHLAELGQKENRATLLPNYVERIATLRASANYMGYERLAGFYETWHEQSQSAAQAWQQEMELPLDFMAENVARLHNIFPQLAITPAEAVETTTASVVEPSAVVSKEDARPADEQALFQRLSAALEAPSHDAATEEAEELPLDVFDEILSPAIPEPVLPTPPPEPERRKSRDQREEQDRRSDSSGERRLLDRRTGVTSDRAFKKSVRVDAEKIDTLMNQVGELIVDRSYLFQLFNEMRELQQEWKEAGLAVPQLKRLRAFNYRLGEAIVSLGRTSNELQEGVMKVRMLPIAQLFNRYPRLIHDLTRNVDKEVRLEVRGEDTELDKMIIEEVSDPLIHIIRNAVDHGLETKAERNQQNKEEVGTLILEAYHESNHIVIEVSDDGRGMNLEKIRNKALEKGLHTAEELERMTGREITRLVMVPGFSTAARITNTSGRGVGMDVVKRNIEKLNGTIEIDSSLGVSTCIRLKIPLTLAIISALMVRVGKNHFTIPLANVEETLRIFDQDTTTIENTEMIHLRDRTLPIFRLTNLFGSEADTTPSNTTKNRFFVVVVNTGSRRIGLVVDELLGQEEVVIKPLVDYLQEKSGFSGATIIGDGRISLILDVYELVNMTMNQQIARQQALRHKRHSGAGFALH